VEVLPLIESKLSQKPLDSKKAIYALFAASSVLVVFAVSAALIVLHADASKDIVELANLVVLFFGAVATTLITGQSAMDWKAMSSLQHISEDQHIDSNAPAPEVMINHSIHKPRFYDDHSVSG